MSTEVASGEGGPAVPAGSPPPPPPPPPMNGVVEAANTEETDVISETEVEGVVEVGNEEVEIEIDEIEEVDEVDGADELRFVVEVLEDRVVPIQR